MRPIAQARSQSIHARGGRALAARAGTLAELYRLLRQGGRWWLIPMVTVLIGTAILLVAVAAVEYVAPFVYTIF
jgi:hypothetical protein